jgi:hypothetical protein
MPDTTHEAPEADCWLTSATVDWLDEYEGPAIGRKTVVYNTAQQGMVRFVKADLVQAAVAAALTEAAEQAEGWGAIVDHPSVYMSGPSRNAQRIAKGFAEEIRALITPDAQAALDRVVAEQREKDAKVAFDAGCGWQALRTAALSSSWPEDAAKHLASEHAAFAIAAAIREGSNERSEEGK